MLTVAHCPEFCHAVPATHRFPMAKYDLIPKQLLADGVIGRDNLFVPRPVSDDEIATTHAKEYLNSLINQTISDKAVRKIGLPMSPALVQRERLVSGATYQCALYAIKYGISLSTSGGTHHACYGHGEGFCIFNDVCIATNLLLNQGLKHRVLIVDLDVHQGNGNASLMADKDNVFVFSMHGDKNYPFIKPPSDLDIALPNGTGDDEYLSQLYDALPKIMASFCPDFIFYQAGADVLASDTLGKLNLTLDGCAKRDHFVLSTAKTHQVPIAVVMGGGYSPDIHEIVTAHCQTFKIAKDLYGD